MTDFRKLLPQVDRFEVIFARGGNQGRGTGQRMRRGLWLVRLGFQAVAGAVAGEALLVQQVENA